MTVADGKKLGFSKSRMTQRTLFGTRNPRKWDARRISHQWYFVATMHDFLKKELQVFCKAKGIKRSGRKTALVKRIWEQNFTFTDILEHTSQHAAAPPPKKTMRVVERIQVKRSKALRVLCHTCKNLYNQGNYLIRTTYTKEQRWVRYLELYEALKRSENYTAIPAQTAQQTLRLLDKNWKSFYKAIAEWKEHPEKFTRRPCPIGYKPKDGESIAIFTNQQCRINGDQLVFPSKANLPPITVNPDRLTTLHQVRILPRGIYYIIEIVHEREITPQDVDPARIIAIDLGLNNIVCVVNNAGLRPWVVKGGMVKSINQYYNKMCAKYQSMKDKQKVKKPTKRLQRITRKRNNKITDFFHKLSRAILTYCVQHRFGHIVVGYNKRWKENCTLGKRNNQNFVPVPFQKLIKQLEYKAELLGIQVTLVEESHTSKCSFLDGAPITHHEHYLGKRIKRGLFRAATGQVINADVNGAYNILRKAFPNAITADGIEGLGFVPYSVKPAELKHFRNLNSPNTTQSPNSFQRGRG